MKILVLGSKGTIGRPLVKLLRKKHEVHEWDILIDNSHDLRDACPYTGQFDFVFFLAYDIGGSKYLDKQNTSFIKNNMKIMLNVFEELERSKVRFIFASSQMDNMDNLLGIMKKFGTQYTTILNNLTARLWNVYGPEKIGLKSHVIPDFIEQFIKNGNIKLLTDGQEERQFLHAEDCARALECCMNNFNIFIGVSVIDISNFEWIKIIDLANIISNDNIIGSRIDTIQKNNEPDPFILDYWKPIISLTDGIDMIQMMRIIEDV